MERLKHMKESLMSCVQGKMGDLSSVDTGELGAAIDMIKDLEEAIYYKTITESMKESKEEKEKYYTPPMMYNRYMAMPDRYADMSMGRMYYGDGNEGRDGYSGNGSRYASNGNASNSNQGGNYNMGGNSRREYPIEIRDYREGNSPMTRRMYMESKELHKDKNLRMKELEKYMHELTDDLKEMIEGASPEEKQMLQEKISTLAHKIV